MRKQFLLFMLALLPLAASADAVLIGNLYYNLKTEGGVNVAEVTANPSGYTGDIVIPPTVTSGGVEYSVTRIGDEAFYNCTGLTSIDIPNSIKSIGYNTFYNCNSLTSITIPNSVKSIGSNAFSGCSKLTSVACYAENVPTTASDAFREINNLGSITLYVPASSVDAYKAAVPWKQFKVLSLQVEVDGIYYELNPVGNVAKVIKKPSGYYEGDIEIPAAITYYEKDWSVTSIGKSAFYECFGLTSVTIPNSVTSIETAAFGNCAYLTSITIPNSVTNIGESAFWMCKRLTTITIPNRVTSIGEKAFQHCEGLTSVTIGNGVTSIGEKAFQHCEGLTSIACYAEGVPITGENAFGFCNNVTALYVPSSSVDAYSGTAPWSGFNVKSGQVEVDGIYYELNPVGNVAKVIKNPDRYTGNIVIPSKITCYEKDWSVTSIGDGAFLGCENMTSVTIPNSVTSIGSMAFGYCRGLTSVIVPSSVKSIGNMAFYYCTGLTSVTINSGSIGDDAFYGCSDLTSLRIGNKVTSIGKRAFYECTSLISITIPNSVTSIGDIAFYNSGLTSVTINSGVESIGMYAFSCCADLTSITIGSGVTSIGHGVFNDCTSLTSIVCKARDVPETGQNGQNAFYGITQSNVTLYVPSSSVVAYSSTSPWSSFGEIMAMSVEIDGIYYNLGTKGKIAEVTQGPNKYTGDIEIPPTVVDEDGVEYSVTGIGKYAFVYCSDLTSVTIPNSVTSIGEGAFNGCSGLTSIEIPNGVTSIAKEAFNGCTGLTSVTIPNSVTSIEYGTFFGCNGLTSIAIPNSVTSIGEVAFAWCTGLTSIACYAEDVPETGPYTFTGIVDLGSISLYVPSSSVDDYNSAEPWKQFKVLSLQVEVDGIYYYLYSEGNEAEVIKHPDGYKGDIVIPSTVTYDKVDYSVKSIGEYAFSYCTGLTSITLPNSVTSIGYLALYGCTGLTGIAVASDNPKYDSRGGCNAIIETASNTLVQGCKSTVIPNGVTNIGKYAFAICTGLTSIDIPSSVASIGYYAFSGCTGLTSIDIPNSVVSIEAHAFTGCEGLTSLDIPNSVKTIGDGAFAICEGLTSITIGNSVTSIGARAFFDCTSLTSIICYAESVPKTGADVFYRTDQGSITLYVPASSVDAYKATSPWRSFKEVLPIESLEPKTFMATITEAGWATLYLPFAASVPEGVTAYTITGVENGALVKEEVADVIPSYTGVLLKGDAGEYVFEEAEEPEPIEANLLVGTTKDEGETFNEPGFKYYILANDAENGIGFYFQKDTNGKSALCGQYKAVLVLPEKTDAIGFRLDGATMIEAVEAATDDVVIFDLTGRRVQDAASGIYIVNGKKVLVK